MAKTPIYIILNGPHEVGKTQEIARGLMYRFKLLNEELETIQNKKWAKVSIERGEGIANAICNEPPFKLNVVQDSFSAPMKHFLATCLGVKYDSLKKDTMLGVLHGYTPNDFLIDLSERYIKERYGDDAFGRWLVHRVLRLEPLPDLVIVDGSGFSVELMAIGHLARIVRITRPGKDFQGDSRSYLDNPHYELVNDGTLDELQPKLDDLTNWCINQLPDNRRPPELVE